MVFYSSQLLQPHGSLPTWLQHKVVPVIRTNTPEEALWIAQCLHQVGVNVLEFTLTIPDVWQVVKEFKQAVAWNIDFKVGMGTLKSMADLEHCLSNEMAFTASPGFIAQAYHVAAKHNHCYIGGAITPSELTQVVQDGGHYVKLFPIAPMGAMAYFKSVTTLFPELTCIPFGGILPAQVADYFKVGAVTVGLGSQLMPPTQWFKDNRTQDYLAFLQQTQLFQASTAHNINRSLA